MRTILAFALSLAAGTATMYAVAAHAAPPAGSCLGGCLPTALAAPTPVFPANYECTTNWPFAIGHASCAVVDGPESNYTITEVTRTYHGHTEVVGRVRN